MLKIGMIGPEFLLRRDQEFFYEQQIRAAAITTARQLEGLDGLLITGWRRSDYLWQLRRLQPELSRRAESLSLLGVAAGAQALGRGGLLPVLDCRVTLRAGRQITTAALEMPGFVQERFTAAFLPEVRFSELAPNLGVLCRDQRRGPVVVRQGDHLACGYVAELTPRPHIYSYWLEMVAALKNSKVF